MDIKLKSSHKKRMRIAIAAVIIVAVCNLCLFPVIGREAEKGEIPNQEVAVNYDFMQVLQRLGYVLYYDHVGYGDVNQEAAAHVNAIWANELETWRSSVDYYAVGETGEEKNTAKNLEELLPAAHPDTETLEWFRNQYQCYFTLVFQEDGELSVENVWSRDGLEDEVVKALLWANRQNSFAEEALEYVRQYQFEEEEIPLNAVAEDYMPKNFRIVYGIPETLTEMLTDYDQAGEYWQRLHRYAESGGKLLFWGSLAALLLVLLLLTSNRIWQGTVDYGRRGSWYLMEIAIIGVLLMMHSYSGFIEMNVQYMGLIQGMDPWEVLRNGSLEQVMNMLEAGGVLALLYGGWYLSLAFIRPVFALGIRRYIREYSLIYCICTKGVSWCRNFWRRTKYEVSHVDFSNRTMRTIRKIVILNFLILTVLSFFWFFGIFALAIYSFILFFILKNQYDKMEEKYRQLMHATSRIAKGDLQYEDTRDWGVFEPFKAELSKIRQGFSKAVEREVKSERMKTELITNVSHDLKTPLTAITTYVELLKDETATPEQRASYVEILEKKSLRLKILVEDLLDVSKATSQTIQLDLMEVDVVNLLKQVCVEHENGFENLGLEVKWKTPEKKVIRMLDNQKTWRIFENLFANIEKYAMPGSRVFIEAQEEEDVLSVIIKNMSAQEINVSGAEITERFVRGDAARTTEGSGLGLAIAKSFTEAQGGTFEVAVDGDLFKVTLCWKKA